MSYLTQELVKQLKEIKFIVYLRKSSEDNEDRQIRSIPGQRMDIDEQLVNKYGIKVIKPYLEESQTAFKEGRPQFNEVLQMTENNQAQGVIVWHPNRLARNYGDGGRFVQAMSNSKIKVVLSCAGIFENNPRDKEYLMTEFTRATRDSDDKSEAVKRGNRVKFTEKKQWIGPAKPGWLNFPNPVTREKEILEDPDRFPLLRRGIQLVLSGTFTPMQALYKL
ncbi:MAG: resolvase domain-containing protein, partial [Candidatus Woesebacteria bacterium GW2011_GWB1_38_5b]